jgi:riboflavin transporter FmnP
MNNPVAFDYRTKRIFYIVRIGMLATLSFILMMFEFPLPIFPAFLQFDASQVPVAIGTFSMGPLSGIAILLVKNLLNLFFHSSTLGVGELADFLVGGAFVLTSGFIYKFNKNRKGAIISMSLGTIAAVVAGTVLNYYLFIPLYETVLHYPITEIVKMGTNVNSHITDLKSFVVLSIAPFNLVKWVGITVITSLIYKKISPMFHWR